LSTTEEIDRPLDKFASPYMLPTPRSTISTVTMAHRWLSCGSNATGQLGLGDTEDRAQFDPIEVIDGDELAAEVFVGERQTWVVAIGLDGASGLLAVGALTDNAKLGSSHGYTFRPYRSPSCSKGVAKLSCGWEHSALIAGGELFVIGSGGTGQLGLGPDRTSCVDWQRVARTHATWSNVACSRSFTVGVARCRTGAPALGASASGDQVLAWGLTRHGATGLRSADFDAGGSGSAADATGALSVPLIAWEPTVVSAVARLLRLEVQAAPSDHPSASPKDGSASSLLLSEVVSPLDAGIAKGGADAITGVAVGMSHTLLLTGDGSVVSFGSNRLGQCGRPAHPVHEPADFGGEVPGVAIARPSAALKLSGSTVRKPRFQATLQPGFVPGFGRAHNCVGASCAHFNAVRVVSGWSHVGCLAEPCRAGQGSKLDASWTLLTWGRGDLGQLGRGIPTPAPDGCAPTVAYDAVPRPVQLVHPACPHLDVHSAAMGTGAVSSLPAQAVASTLTARQCSASVADAACGSEHMLAVGAGCGCLWAWGWNEHGNLGLGAVQATAAAGSGHAGAGGAEDPSIVPLPARVPGFGCWRQPTASGSPRGELAAAPQLLRAEHVSCGGAASFVRVLVADPAN
jgi:alpha-tubulin suppressor-like RCC1 family protein